MKTCFTSRFRLAKLERAVHSLWLEVSADTQTPKRKNPMPKTALEELAEIKAAYEAQKQKIADLVAAASAAGSAVPADVQSAIDALAAEVETDTAPPAPAPTPAPSA